MNIKAQRNLLAEAVKKLSNVITKGNNEDPGHFLFLKVKNNKFILTINREDLIATVSLDPDLISNLNINGDGEYSVGGDLFIKIILDTTVEGNSIIEYLPTNSSYQAIEKEKGKEENKETEETPKEFNGSIKIILPGLVKEEKCLLQCIKKSSPPEIIPDISTEVIIAGNKFISLLQKIGIASGKSTGDPSWSQVFVKSIGDTMDLVTFNGLQLGWAQFNTDKPGDILSRVPYDVLASVSSMLNKDIPVHLYSTTEKDLNKGLVICQDICLGTMKVGTVSYRLFPMHEKFPKFEKMIKQLSFRSTFKANLSNMKQVVRRLNIVDISRTKMVFSVADKTVTFSKESSEASFNNIILPLIYSEGNDMEIYVSSRILKSAVDKCEEEEVEIKLTGPNSLIQFNVSPEFKMFFQPYTQES